MKIYKQYMYSYPHKTAYRAIDGSADIDIKSYLGKITGSDNSLYIHVPFCLKKCGFCNLFSISCGSKNYLDDYFNQYVEAIKRQGKAFSQHLAQGVSFNSIIFGGGTPFLLKDQQIKELIELAKSYFNVADDFYGIIETTPKESTIEKLQTIKDNGLNRISVGVQSFVESELRTLKREFVLDDITTALENIQRFNFDVFNVDLIYGIPKQTQATLKYSIDQVVKYQPNEIFIYPLYVQENGNLYQNIEIDEKAAQQLYFFAKDYLLSLGYFQHSMRRFTKESNQDNKSCGFETTLALGCGGRSYIDNLHFCEEYETDNKKAREIINGFIARDDFFTGYKGYVLNNDEMRRRYLIKNLFTTNGLDLADYQKEFSSSSHSANALTEYSELQSIINDGYAHTSVNESGNKMILTDEGLSLSDYLGTLLISKSVSDAIVKGMNHSG